MDISLVKMPDSQIVPVPESDRQSLTVFPQYGYENSTFCILAGPDIQQLRLQDDKGEGNWICRPACQTITLNKESLAPGAHNVTVEWRTPRGRGEKLLSFVVRPGWLVGEGLPLDCALDAENYYIARPTGVEIWDRQQGNWRGQAHLPGMHDINAVTASDGSQVIIGTRNGWLFSCCVKTGLISAGICLPDKGPITTLFFWKGNLIVVAGMRRVHFYKINGPQEMQYLQAVEATSDIHGVAEIAGQLQFAKLSLEQRHGRVPYLSLGTEFSLLLLPENFMLFNSQGSQTYPLGHTLGRCERILYLGVQGGKHQFLALTAEKLYRLEYPEGATALEIEPILVMRPTIPSLRSQVTPTGEIIIATDQNLQVWAAASLDKSRLKNIIQHPASGFATVIASAYSPDLTMVALGDEQGRIALYDLHHRQVSVQTTHYDTETKIVSDPNNITEGRHAYVTALEFIPQTSFLLSGGMDFRICLHEVIGSVFITRWTRGDLDGNVQHLTVLPELQLFAVTCPYKLLLFSWDQDGGEIIASWNYSKAVLDPVCCGPHGFPLVVGDWDGSIHLFEPGKKQGLKRRWSLQVSKDSLIALRFLNSRHIFAVTEGNVGILIDINKKEVVATAPFFRLNVGTRKCMDITASVEGKMAIVANTLVPESLNLYAPFYVLPLQALGWHGGELFFDQWDINMAMEEPKLSSRQS